MENFIDFVFDIFGYLWRRKDIIIPVLLIAPLYIYLNIEAKLWFARKVAREVARDVEIKVRKDED